MANAEYQGFGGLSCPAGAGIAANALVQGLVENLQALKVQLNALVTSGAAEILSNPSVLVLDGRQARIQIGQQIPVVSATATQIAVEQSVEYFQVGIVLNLRPRIDELAAEVTMQVETIVSAINAAGTVATGAGDDVLFAPVIDNRQVQTFVRIADNTPFIIGGLIATEKNKQHSGVPGLSRIPVLGRLFSRKTSQDDRKEVIIVLTPHIVPEKGKRFGRLIPEESPTFDSLNNQLFQGTYRIRSRDVFELSFVREDEELKQLVARLKDVKDRKRFVERVREATGKPPDLAASESFSRLWDERWIPGEEILVRRMFWETVRHLKFERFVDVDQIIFFERRESGIGFQVRHLRDELAKPGRPLVLEFTSPSKDTDPVLFKVLRGEEATADHPPQPIAKCADAGRYSILLRDDKALDDETLDDLRRVLVLKRILALNSSLELTLDSFYVGRQIAYPRGESMSQSTHLVDAETARLLYEVKNYYTAFETRRRCEIRCIKALLDLEAAPEPLDLEAAAVESCRSLR